MVVILENMQEMNIRLLIGQIMQGMNIAYMVDYVIESFGIKKG